MKAFLTAIPLILFSVLAQSQQVKSFTLTGSVAGKTAAVAKVYLTYKVAGIDFRDSAITKNGDYTFNGKIPEPIRAVLMGKPALASEADNWRPTRKDVAYVFLTPAKIQVTSVDSFSNVIVTGSEAHDAYQKLEAETKALTNAADHLNSQYMIAAQAKEEAEMKKVAARFDSLIDERKRVYGEYLRSNLHSPIAMYIIYEYAGHYIDADKVDPLFNLLPASVKSYPSYKAMSDQLVIARKTSIGKQASDFTQNDTSGTPISLSSFKGKYVLVDFWASWCGPCRRENPNVVNAYNKYKDKNFTVLGVSLDQPKAQAKWLKAIHDDKLTWTHVSDLQFWNNYVAKLYGVRSIPFNLLLDKEGTIVAKNLRGEKLHLKLAEVLQ
jgi:peroxiredoxin